MYNNNERSCGKRIILFPLMAEILHISRKFEHLDFGKKNFNNANILHFQHICLLMYLNYLINNQFFF